MPLKQQIGFEDIPTKTTNINLDLRYSVFNIMGISLGNNLRIDNLPSGFYILKYGNETIKIYKR